MERNGSAMNTMELVDCTEDYWEFVRELRMDSRVSHGFIEKADISEEDQKRYMSKYQDCYRVCLMDGEPCGYVGVIDDDIRVCVHPDYWNLGVGKFMINECKKIWPESLARVKTKNEASLALFKSCGFKQSHLVFLGENPRHQVLVLRQ